MKLIFSLNTQIEPEISKVVSFIKPYLKQQTLLLLEGELGAGKTTFVNHLLRSLNYNLSNSPTYAIRNTYNITEAVFFQVEHVDLYRLSSEDEIESVGLWDIFEQTTNLVLIEWASRLKANDWPINWSQYVLKIYKKQHEHIYEFYQK